MVDFDRENNTFSITINGTESEYYETIRALSCVISCAKLDLIDEKTLFYASRLIGEMLPGPEQVTKIHIE